MSSKNQPPIPQAEIEDWFENPITERFFSHIDRALRDIHEDKKNAYVPRDPQATQENYAWSLGAEWAFGEIKSLQEGKLLGEVDEQE